MSTYRERERRRRTAGRPPVNKTKLLVFVLTIATVYSLMEGIGWLTSRPRYELAGVQWGEPVNGLRAGLEFIEVDVTRNGWPRCALNCRLVLENAGDTPLRVLGIWHQFVRSDRPIIELTDQGEPATCRWPWRSLRRPPAPQEHVVIPPGESHAAEERIVLDKWGLERDFSAGVAYVYRNDDEEAEAVEPDETGQYRRARVRGLWTGEARSRELRISRGLPAWLGAPLVALYLFGMLGLPHLIYGRIERRREAKAEPPVDDAATEQVQA